MVNVMHHGKYFYF